MHEEIAQRVLKLNFWPTSLTKISGFATEMLHEHLSGRANKRDWSPED
jgi:hypothetical protein